MNFELKFKMASSGNLVFKKTLCLDVIKRTIHSSYVTDAKLTERTKVVNLFGF